MYVYTLTDSAGPLLNSNIPRCHEPQDLSMWAVGHCTLQHLTHGGVKVIGKE